MSKPTLDDLKIAANNMLIILQTMVSPSREQSLAITKLEESVQWAETAVKRAKERGDHG